MHGIVYIRYIFFPSSLLLAHCCSYHEIIFHLLRLKILSKGLGRGGRWWTEGSGEKRGFKGNKTVGFCGREVLKNRDRINQVLRRAICLKSVHEQYCLNEIIDKLMQFMP